MSTQDTTLSHLPELREEYTGLQQEHIENFRTQGHVLLRNVASADEVGQYRQVITDAAMRYNTETRALKDRDTYGKAFLQISNLWAQDEAVKRFVFAKRFAGVAAKLLGVERVRMYHDQALYKEAGGGPTPWHQDQYYWPVDTHNTITMWMPLVDVSANMGTMSFVSGTHKLGFLGKFAISDESQAIFEQMISEKNLKVVHGQAMATGDATFHYGWTLHNAPGNSTDRMREVMTIIYVADGARVTEPNSKAQENDLARWMPGLKPGDLVDSPLNPLI